MSKGSSNSNFNKNPSVRPKKHLGQHFLTDLNIAKKIADTLTLEGYENVLEIGPGMGVLTQFLLEKDLKLIVLDLDKESISYLNNHLDQAQLQIVEADF